MLGRNPRLNQRAFGALSRPSGYWTEPVVSYYRQKCQAGLYQALHRIRPYLVGPRPFR